jgi:Xaa-Pro aminopeptidase
MRLLLLAAGLGFMCEDVARAQEQSYFEWTTMPFSVEEFAARRDAFATRLTAGDGGIFLAPSIDGVSGGETFRQNDTFMYFTGLELPRSILVIGADGAVTLFAPKRDPRFENPTRANDFPGRPLTNDPALRIRSGIEDIRPSTAFPEFVETLVVNGVTVHIDMGSAGSVGTPRLGPHVNWNVADHFHAFLRTTVPAADLRNAYALIAAQRMVKTAAEVDRMRATAALTARAIVTAAGQLHAGVDERSLEAAFEAACKRGGSQRLAFSSIIKSGPNSLWPWRILASHYNRRNRVMHDGDLVIFDVGCELDGYVSDVGRTFPVSGTFTPEQRVVLEMVTSIADTIITHVRPGVTLRELTERARAAIPPSHRRYMQTGSFYGHHIGLATGDPSSLDARLEPGMIFTVEPWYYNHDADIAVFIEEEVLVTPRGAEVLTAGLPRTPTALEALVRNR